MYFVGLTGAIVSSPRNEIEWGKVCLNNVANKRKKLLHYFYNVMSPTDKYFLTKNSLILEKTKTKNKTKQKINHQRVEYMFTYKISGDIY